jgi:fatty acid-binding protein DegV
VAVAGVAVVTDSTSSLPRERAALAGITVIPLQVVIGEQSRPETEVAPALVAAALRDGRSVSTSRPSPEAFEAAYDALAGSGYQAVVSVHLSGKVSGTVQAAGIAARTAAVPVTVLDSETVGMATGFAALAGADAARAGQAVDDVSARIQARARVSRTFFCLDSLEHLQRGGRMPTGAGSAAAGSTSLAGSTSHTGSTAGGSTALAAKSLLTVVDGEIRPYERVRTGAHAVDRLVELGLAAAGEVQAGTTIDVAVHHLDNAEAARELADRVAAGLPGIGEVVIAELGPVLGGHVGPRTIGLVISPRT